MMLALGIECRTPLDTRKDFEVAWGVLYDRCHFMSSFVVCTVVMAELVAFVFMCQSHPSEIDTLCQLILAVVVGLIYALLWIVFESVDQALSKILALRLILRLPRAPRVVVPSRSLGVPTPPPLSFLQVA